MAFTGLSTLSTSLEKAIGSILVLNEIGDSDAYCLAHADRGKSRPTKSGYSFGGNQMDLAASTKARAILKDILKNAGTCTAQEGEAFFVKIEKKLFEQGNPKALTISEQATINKAFATPYGRRKIDDTFVHDIREKINEVNRVIHSLPEGNIKQTLLTLEVLTFYLVDYHNQFHIDAKILGDQNNGNMYQFLSGKRISTTLGSLQLGSTISTKDLQNFGFHTHYHIAVNPKDLPRRYKNIEMYIERNKMKSA